jgi:serine/threonine-protein kinase ULK4
LKFYNWYETRNHFWVILEYCSGGDLHTLLEQDKKLPEQSIKKLAYELLEGLSYLHAQGIIFGDLKPSNVMVNEYCHLKLCDFSLAKKVTDLSNISFKNSAEERTSSATHASSKNKAGTPFYMAPELFQDNGVYSYYSDFWSLGCMLMEMATGKPPFYSSSLKELISKIMTEEIKPVDGFTVEFNDLLMKLL